jgi:phosphoglycolate phosphatase-like HAD superfamily hydrolase
MVGDRLKDFEAASLAGVYPILKLSRQTELEQLRILGLSACPDLSQVLEKIRSLNIKGKLNK